METENNNSPIDDFHYKDDDFIKLDLTESISECGIKEITVEKGAVCFVFGLQNRSVILFQQSKPNLEKLCRDIRNKLTKRLEYSISNQQTLEQALDDIESQIVETRDKIFAISNHDTNSTKSNHVDDEFKLKFIEEAKELRRHFEQSSDPYKEWQIKVVEKYDILKNLFKKYYQEAWTFMEFCLSVKSILNITDFTLPFMGVLIAPPSSTKTMVIELFRKYPHTFYSDSFTPSSLVSHNASLTEERLQEVDMLPKMKDKLMLTPELS